MGLCFSSLLLEETLAASRMTTQTCGIKKANLWLWCKDFVFGAVCSLRERNSNSTKELYYLQYVMTQTQKYLSFPQANKQEHPLKPERWQGPPHKKQKYAVWKIVLAFKVNLSNYEHGESCKIKLVDTISTFECICPRYWQSKKLLA